MSLKRGDNGCNQSGSGNKEPQEQWATVVCIRMKAGQDLGSEPQLHACSIHTLVNKWGQVSTWHRTRRDTVIFKDAASLCATNITWAQLQVGIAVAAMVALRGCHTHLMSPMRGRPASDPSSIACGTQDRHLPDTIQMVALYSGPRLPLRMWIQQRHWRTQQHTGTPWCALASCSGADRCETALLKIKKKKNGRASTFQ